MGLAVLMTAITAGLVGAGCSHLLHLIEGLVFGDASGTLLHAISSVPWWHRVCALGGAGLIGGISWYLYARAGGKPVSLPKAVNGQKMPILLTFWHSINQIVIVGMGASIGREVAPREISASLGGKIADFLYLPPEQRRIIVGCAAGAGLAAVYSLPLSGAVFALEILLIEVTASAVWPALIISGGAVLVAHGWVRSDPFYTLPEAGQLLPTASLTLWAVHRASPWNHRSPLQERCFSMLCCSPYWLASTCLDDSDLHPHRSDHCLGSINRRKRTIDRSACF